MKKRPTAHIWTAIWLALVLCLSGAQAAPVETGSDQVAKTIRQSAPVAILWQISDTEDPYHDVARLSALCALPGSNPVCALMYSENLMRQYALPNADDSLLTGIAARENEAYSRLINILHVDNPTLDVALRIFNDEVDAWQGAVIRWVVYRDLPDDETMKTVQGKLLDWTNAGAQIMIYSMTIDPLLRFQTIASAVNAVSIVSQASPNETLARIANELMLERGYIALPRDMAGLKASYSASVTSAAEKVVFALGAQPNSHVARDVFSLREGILIARLASTEALELSGTANQPIMHQWAAADDGIQANLSLYVSAARERIGIDRPLTVADGDLTVSIEFPEDQSARIRQMDSTGALTATLANGTTGESVVLERVSESAGASVPGTAQYSVHWTMKKPVAFGSYMVRINLPGTPPHQWWVLFDYKDPMAKEASLNTPESTSVPIKPAETATASSAVTVVPTGLEMPHESDPAPVPGTESVTLYVSSMLWASGDSQRAVSLSAFGGSGINPADINVFVSPPNVVSAVVEEDAVRLTALSEGDADVTVMGSGIQGEDRLGTVHARVISGTRAIASVAVPAALILLVLAIVLLVIFLTRGGGFRNDDKLEITIKWADDELTWHYLPKRSGTSLWRTAVMAGERQSATPCQMFLSAICLCVGKNGLYLRTKGKKTVALTREHPAVIKRQSMRLTVSYSAVEDHSDMTDP